METKPILMQCPTTNEWVRTGFAGTQDNLASFVSNSSQCSACGQMHTWSGADAKLQD